MSVQNIRLIGIFVVVAALLAIPFIAMQLTSEVKWKLGDFIAAGVLLLGSGLACEAVLRIFPSLIHRVAICLVLLAGLCVVWAELAVGVFGTPFAGS